MDPPGRETIWETSDDLRVSTLPPPPHQYILSVLCGLQYIGQSAISRYQKLFFVVFNCVPPSLYRENMACGILSCCALGGKFCHALILWGQDVRFVDENFHSLYIFVKIKPIFSENVTVQSLSENIQCLFWK